eukprot:TRINITY_DN4126_c0_g1_i1.p1 TRINITY_DN4126_c0_g1~~TRINITY_DN4126_c0_g1_i1.p1  ORF type:complete len:232 (+),score=88.04 TRINITY_DN4126_c0_g1_i1:109-804(+)
MTMENQLERLLSQQFRNPYDVLLLTSEASEEEIRKQYRSISILVHPDKCKDPRAADAFHVAEQAYKTLMDPEKKKIYQRIMREARERTEYERKKENKKRERLGQPPLPEETFESQFRDMCTKLFDEIEERKQHYIRLEENQRRREKEELENKRLQEKVKQMTEEEWEQTREQRVENWRKFASKKSVIGTKNSNMQIRAPQTKMEERPASAPKVDAAGKPMGINEDYKKQWK